MLYLDFARYKENFILEREAKLPNFIKNILYFFRKISGQVMEDKIDGKKVVSISNLKPKTLKKLDKILKVDVTKNICVCDDLMENEELLQFLKDRKLKIMDGKWIFKYLICDISKFICKENGLDSKDEEISFLLIKPDLLIFDTIKRLSEDFKSVNVVTTKPKKLKESLRKIVPEDSFHKLNITSNFKKACSSSRIIFNIDFDEKTFNKVIFSKDSTIINLDKNIEVKQDGTAGKVFDFCWVNLPIKYKKIYNRLNGFNSTILYESLIYKKTLDQNIWNEIAKDKTEILLLLK